jgi:hypothetical protein
MNFPVYSNNEKDAIRKYQDEAYSINAYLKNGITNGKWDAVLKDLDSAIEKYQIPEPIVLYRASIIKDIVQYCITEGDILYFHSPTYMSTAHTLINNITKRCVIQRHFNSLGGKYDGDYTPVLMKIHCPQNYKVADIEKITGDNEEMEILIGRNRKFKIIGDKKDIAVMIPEYFDNVASGKCNVLYQYELEAI